MSRKKRIRRSSVIGLALLLTTTGIALSQDSARSREGAMPILQYTQIHHMLAQQDPVPLLRIYSDGWVRVHYPVYMHRAGDYELKLQPTEVDDLLADLEADGLYDFDRDEALRRRALAEARRRSSTGTLMHVSDVTETVIRVWLDPARAGGPPRSKTVRWNNVYTDAKTYPDLAPIQAISTSEQRLRRILERGDLVRLSQEDR